MDEIKTPPRPPSPEPAEAAVEPRGIHAAAPQQILVDRAGAAAVLCVSPSHFDALCRGGAMGPRAITLGSRRCPRWVVAELAAWCAAGCPPRVEWDRRPLTTSPQEAVETGTSGRRLRRVS